MSDIFGYPDIIGEAEMERRKKAKEEKAQAPTQQTPEEILNAVKKDIAESQNYEKKLNEAHKKEGSKGIDFKERDKKIAKETARQLERDLAKQKFLKENKEEIERISEAKREEEIERIKKEEERKERPTIKDLSGMLGQTEDEIVEEIKRHKIRTEENSEGEVVVPMRELAKLGEGDSQFYQA